MGEGAGAVKECIVIGNGPSLNSVSRLFLDSLPTYGCNFIGLMYCPTFYVCVDKNALERPEMIYETVALADVAYLRHYFGTDPRPDMLYNLPNVEIVTRKDYALRWERSHTGGTTTYLMLKIALEKGYDRVYLVGVDHTVEHFAPDYPAFKLSGWEYREWHYRLVAEAYKKAGKQIINLSAPSALDMIFDREL